MPDERNIVFVGAKPFMNYVTAVVMQFTTVGTDQVKVMSRGKFISKAVDVCEVSSKKFLEKMIEVENIKISSEEFENKDKRKIRVSAIEITLKKKKDSPT